MATLSQIPGKLADWLTNPSVLNSLNLNFVTECSNNKKTSDSATQINDSTRGHNSSDVERRCCEHSTRAGFYFEGHDSIRITIRDSALKSESFLQKLKTSDWQTKILDDSDTTQMTRAHHCIAVEKKSFLPHAYPQCEIIQHNFTAHIGSCFYKSFSAKK